MTVLKKLICKSVKGDSYCDFYDEDYLMRTARNQNRVVGGSGHRFDYNDSASSSKMIRPPKHQQQKKSSSRAKKKPLLSGYNQNDSSTYATEEDGSSSSIEDLARQPPPVVMNFVTGALFQHPPPSVDRGDAKTSSSSLSSYRRSSPSNGVYGGKSLDDLGFPFTNAADEEWIIDYHLMESATRTTPTWRNDVASNDTSRRLGSTSAGTGLVPDESDDDEDNQYIVEAVRKSLRPSRASSSLPLSASRSSSSSRRSSGSQNSINQFIHDQSATTKYYCDDEGTNRDKENENQQQHFTAYDIARDLSSPLPVFRLLDQDAVDADGHDDHNEDTSIEAFISKSSSTDEEGSPLASSANHDTEALRAHFSSSRFASSCGAGSIMGMSLSSSNRPSTISSSSKKKVSSRQRQREAAVTAWLLGVKSSSSSSNAGTENDIKKDLLQEVRQDYDESLQLGLRLQTHPSRQKPKKSALRQGHVNDNNDWVVTPPPSESAEKKTTMTVTPSSSTGAKKTMRWAEQLEEVHLQPQISSSEVSPYLERYCRSGSRRGHKFAEDLDAESYVSDEDDDNSVVSIDRSVDPYAYDDYDNDSIIAKGPGPRSYHQYSSGGDYYSEEEHSVGTMELVCNHMTCSPQDRLQAIDWLK